MSLIANHGALLNQEKVLNRLMQLDELLMKFNQSVAETTPYSISKYLDLPELEQLRILDMIEKYIAVLREKLPQATKSNVEVEFFRLQRAAQDFGMNILDESLFSCLSDEDVIEIYDGLGRQIYRNLMFCKLSSYSLLDVAVNTWQELYERPSHTINGIQTKIIEQFTTPVMTCSFDLEKHILKEKFIFTKLRKTFLMNMKWISPLEDRSTHQRVGVVSISRVDIVGLAGEDGSISIL